VISSYDAEDWEAFEADGLQIAGPASVLVQLERLGEQEDTVG